MRVNKKEQMAKVNEYGQTDAGRSFRVLIAAWITDLREKNDTAKGDDFIRNQGAIRELKLMYKGIGPKVSVTAYDGGFGD